MSRPVSSQSHPTTEGCSEPDSSKAPSNLNRQSYPQPNTNSPYRHHNESLDSDDSTSTPSKSWEVISNVSDHSFQEQRADALNEFGPGTLEYEIAAQYYHQSLQYEAVAPLRDLAAVNRPASHHSSLAFRESRMTEPSSQTITDHRFSHRSPPSDHSGIGDSSPESKQSSHSRTDRSRSTASPAPRRQGPDSQYYDHERNELRYTVPTRIPVQPHYHNGTSSSLSHSPQDSSTTPPRPHLVMPFPSSGSTHVTVEPKPGMMTSTTSLSSLGSFPMFSKAMYIQPDGHIPKGALCFLFGFLLFPLWWLASVWPRESEDVIDLVWKRYNRWMAGLSLIILGAVIGCAIWYSVHDM
ncbi:hypothetical protein H4R33_006842 [Dimargaris cristalligena]|nr:hypothetical protein H4R33_006842 [Dimargaris cristalligena]